MYTGGWGAHDISHHSYSQHSCLQQWLVHILWQHCLQNWWRTSPTPCIYASAVIICIIDSYCYERLPVAVRACRLCVRWGYLQLVGLAGLDEGGDQSTRVVEVDVLVNQAVYNQQAVLPAAGSNSSTHAKRLSPSTGAKEPCRYTHWYELLVQPGNWYGFLTCINKSEFHREKYKL